MGGGQCWFPANKNAYIQWEKYTRAINILCNSSGWACSEEGERPGRRWKIDCIKFSAVIYNNYVIRMIDRERGREKGLNNFGHPPLFMWPGQEQESETLDLQVKKKKKKNYKRRRSLERPDRMRKCHLMYIQQALPQPRLEAPFPCPDPGAPWCSVALRIVSPSTFSFSAQCSMTTRWDGQQRLGWTAASWVGNSRHWGPSVYMFTDVYGSHLSGCEPCSCRGRHSPVCHPPACLPACLPACPPACLLGCLLPASTPIQWELLLHFVSHRMGWFD